MPPKPQPSKKAVQEKTKKLVEDKTFGMKNKKGAKNQRFVQTLQKQVTTNMQAKATTAAAPKKKTELDELDDLNKLLKPVVDQPKLAKDVDPKSVVCLFFKQGMCTKGSKCKFSHDLSVEQKTMKRNLYVDSRDIEKENDKMEDWDEDKLAEVVNKKHGETNANKTEIVCKYFVEAVENMKYGWFWQCPNGEKCIYRHALPPGFILKKDKKTLEDLKKQDEISLEELIENERAALSSKQALTKVTLDSFIQWKKKKLKEKKKAAEQEEKSKKDRVKQGKQLGLSGRDLFTYNPELVGGDDDEAGDLDYGKDDEDGEDGDAGQNEPVAFEIDDTTFLKLAVGGELLMADDDEDDGPGPSDRKEKSSSAELQDGPINEDLFQEELDGADLDDDDDDEDDDDDDGDEDGDGEEDDEEGTSGQGPGGSKQVDGIARKMGRL